MPPASSPARRVLGEKDANASLNISSPRKGQSLSSDPHRTAAVQKQSKVLSEAINVVSASPQAGRKRKITEVEGVEARDWDDEIKASQATDVVSDSASETDQIDTSMLSARSAADTTMTSFGMSASQDHPLEQEFELYEPEVSQRTLDKIHAVSLPQNTSQPSQLKDRPDLTHNISQDSAGMSKYLNLHSDPSSQASDGLQMIDTSLVQSEGRKEETTDSHPAKKHMSEEDRRKSVMEDKAAQLRLRLQLALFKVETRQTNTPFSRLRIPESHRRKSMSPPSLPAYSSFSHRPQSHSISMIPHGRSGFSPEARIAALRAQATMQHKPAVRSLNSLPMPRILPTAFSARWADEEPRPTHTHPDAQSSLIQTDSQVERTQSIPSSPPVSTHSLHIHEDETAAATAVRSRTNSPTEVELSLAPPSSKPAIPKTGGNEQLSSPPPSEGEDDEILKPAKPSMSPSSTLNDKPERSRRLSNSPVKGEAASSLLQLMRSGVVNAENLRGSMCGL